MGQSTAELLANTEGKGLGLFFVERGCSGSGDGWQPGEGVCEFALVAQAEVQPVGLVQRLVGNFAKAIARVCAICSTNDRVTGKGSLKGGSRCFFNEKERKVRAPQGFFGIPKKRMLANGQWG